MSYHCHLNFASLCNRDLISKLNDWITSRKFENQPCNCNASSQNEDGCCVYDGQCNVKLCIYKVTCKECGKFYIGSTKNELKKRFSSHFSSVKQLIERDKKSSSYARHFKNCYVKKYGPNYDVRKIREMGKYEILWEGHAIPTVKTFSTYNCKLCMEEKLAILNAKTRRFHQNINKRKELFSSCRHGGSFHDYCRKVGTDE